MKNLIILSLLYLSFCCNSESFDWVLKSEVTAKAHDSILISITGNPATFSIKIEGSNNTQIEYKSLFNRDGDEYLLLPKTNLDTHYKIYVLHEYLMQNHVHKVKFSTLNETKDIEYYKTITALSRSHYINSNDEKESSLVLIDNLLSKNFTTQRKYTLHYLKHLFLYNLGHFKTIIEYKQNINSNVDGDLDTLIHIQWLESLSYLNLGEFTNAIKFFQTTLENINLKGDLSKDWQLNKAQIQAYLGLSLSLNYYHRQIKSSDGYSELNTALNTAYIIEDDHLVSEILYLLGSYHSAKQDWLQTLATLDIALEYVKKAKTSDNLVGIYNQKALAYRQLNQYGKSLEFYRESIKYIPSGDRSTKANIYNNIATIYEILGDINKAQRYFENSMKEYVSMGSIYGESMALKALGRIYRKHKYYAKAIEVHEKILNYFKNDKEIAYLQTQVELSKDYYSSHDIEMSEVIAIKVLLLSNYTEISTQSLQFFAMKKEGDYHSDFEKLSAFDYKTLNNIYFDNKIQISKEYEYRAILILAMANYKSSNLEFMQYYFNELEDGISKGLIPINDQLDFYSLKMDYLIKNEDSRYNDIAMKSLEIINTTRVELDVSDLALYWTNKAQTIINKYINALVVQNKHNDIFDLLEKYYTVNLREKRNNSTDELIYNKSLSIKKSLNNYINLERNAILKKGDSQQNQADEAKEHFLAMNGSDDHQMEPIPLNYLSIKEIQETLAEDELFLRYYINDNNAFVYVIDKTSSDFITIPDKKTLNTTVKEILDTIKSKRFTKLTESNDFLAQIIPIEKLKSGAYKKLIIIPDGVLNLLPFGALNIGQNGKDYQPMATNINVERTYSASDYFSIIDIPKNPQTVSVFVNPVFIGNAAENIQSQFDQDNKLWEFKQLPYSEKEADHIVEIFTDQEVNLLTGNKATNDNFMSEKTRNSNIIHIASHGFFNESNLEEVGIATSIVDSDNNLSAGILAMREVLYKPFKSNLVVISGCETTLGKEISGEGFNSLSRGLLSQGVGSVIGTIWSISDRATPVFMKEFYTNLKQMNGNVSKALNTSKVNFATQSKYRRYRHPYYWAGFVLTSSNREISKNIF